MAMYAIGLSVLQEEISYEKTQVKQVAYADDLTGAGKISELRKWWDLVKKNGPNIGYTTQTATKSILIVKPEHYENWKGVFFRDSGVTVTKDGQRHLGAVIGTQEFKEKYVEEKVSEWVKEVGVLSDIAKTKPTRSLLGHSHMAYNNDGASSSHHPRHQPPPQTIGKSIRKTFLPALLKTSFIIGEEMRKLRHFHQDGVGWGSRPLRKWLRKKTETPNPPNLVPHQKKIIAQDAKGRNRQNGENLELKKPCLETDKCPVERLERLKKTSCQSKP
ncbi:hypothetical protein GWK47_018062 [Chionoecetes opilio]|uniref:Uncharacterized protein n=1 Tax=Chionoecetes opilio TaxID=41210 RepID=A0A8J5CJJ3_CHIOP|nr:hypothetical protein GWK47_018062 [Chionoecetes opilio]